MIPASNVKCVVFCGEHYNPLGVIRSLGENGYRPDAIVVRSRTPLASHSKWISSLRMVDSIDEGYKFLLDNYVDGNQDVPVFLFASDDKTMAFLDAHYGELAGRLYFFNAGAPGRVAEFMNKDAINRCALRHGMNVLRTWVVDKGDVPRDIEYPVITKSIASTVGGWKADVHICHSEEELRGAYEVIESPRLLLQLYVQKRNEYCLEGFSVNRGKSAMVTIASSYNYLLPDSYSPYMTVSNCDNDEIESNLKAMLEEIGFEGIFETEFLIDQEDKLWFCEINFRNSTWSYASTCAGMPLPVLWMNGMLSGSISEKECWREIPEGFTAMVEINDYITRVKKGGLGKFEWLRQLKSSNCRYFIGKSDWGPILAMVGSKIKRIIKGD